MPYPENYDPAFDGDDAPDAYRVTASELRQFIERIERLEAEKKDIMDAQKEVFAEAKGRGYDVKAMRETIRRRKMDPQVISEFETLVSVYIEALGG